MKEHFKIYVEQLRDGQVEKLSEKLSPDFIDVNESALAFTDPVNISGDVYFADEMLVLHLDIETKARVPCRICNQPVKVDIALHGFYHAAPPEEFKKGTYDYQDLVREAILLEVPALAECNLGQCPQRQTMKKYFKNEDGADGKQVEDGHQPFADFDFNFDKK